MLDRDRLRVWSALLLALGPRRGAGRRRDGGRPARRVLPGVPRRCVPRRAALTATRLGDHRFDDQLDDLSAEARAARVERDRKTLAELPRAVDPKALSRDGRIDFEILRHHLERVDLARRALQAVRGRPAGLRRLPDRERLPAVRPVDPAEGRRTSRTPWRGWRGSRGWSRSPGRRSRTRRGSRPRRRSARRKGAIGFYTDDLFTLAGEPKGQGELGEKAAAIVEALEAHLAFLKDEVLPRSTERLAGRPRAVRQEAGAGAGLRALGRRGAARGRVGGDAGRARDGRDRPAALGDDLPRRARPARRRRGPPADDPPRPRRAWPRTTARPRRSSPTPARPSARSRTFIAANRDPHASPSPTSAG